MMRRQTAAHSDLSLPEPLRLPYLPLENRLPASITIGEWEQIVVR